MEFEFGSGFEEVGDGVWWRSWCLEGLLVCGYSEMEVWTEIGSGSGSRIRRDAGLAGGSFQGSI